MENTEMMVPQSRGTSWLTPDNIEAGLKLAEIMAKAKLVPDHLRNSPGDCLLVIAQAASWRMNPIAVAQCTSIVHGKLCYEGKLVSAVLTSLGAIEGRLSYEFSGKGEDLTVTVTGTPRGSKPVSITGSVGNWKTASDAWKKDPNSMLVYRGTRQWARVYAPEAMLGVMTPDEIEHANLDKDSIVAEAVNATVPEKDRIATEPKATTPPIKKPEAHPAIEAGRNLYKALGADRGGKAIKRLCSLYGVDTPVKVPADRMDAFHKTITDLAQDLDNVEGNLDIFESERGQGVAA